MTTPSTPPAPVGNYARTVVDTLTAAHPSLAGRPLLLRLYALLTLTRGHATTLRDVHDAWALWSDTVNPTHPDLVPFEQLTPDVQAYDARYRDLIHAATAPERVTIIGSVRHPAALHAAAAAEADAGRRVIAVPSWDTNLVDAAAVTAYLPWLDAADTVVVVPRPDGTLDPWTTAELAYAASRGKVIRVLTPSGTAAEATR